MEMQWQCTSSKSRPPGESQSIMVIDRPSQFDKIFDEFVASIGVFKVIGVVFKTDDRPNATGRSKSARAARRRRQRLQNRKKASSNGYSQYASMPQFDAGDSGNGNENENVDEADNVDEEGENGDAPSSDEGERELDEDGVCEFARQRTYEFGKVALISISSVNGYTLVIRACQFIRFPEKLIQLLEGKEFLKIGFGIQGWKHRMYEKYGFFLLNFVDPRRVLYAWKEFFDSYHFERFGVYSVASFLFDRQMQNIDAAACLSSLWSAPDLNPYLKRAAARETQLIIDIYAEMCIRMVGRHPSLFALTKDPSFCANQSFQDELLSVAEGHVNNGFDMEDFGVKVFSTPALQRRFRHMLPGGQAAAGYATAKRDVVPVTFADRVRVRQSKSSIEKYWKGKILYASFDSTLFDRKNPTYGQPITLRRKVGNTLWEMKLEVQSKCIGFVTKGPIEPLIVPALNYYRLKDRDGKDANLDPAAEYANATADGLDDEWQSTLQMEDAVRHEGMPTAAEYWSSEHLYDYSGMEPGAMVLSQETAAFANLTVDTDGCYTEGFNGPQFSPVPSPPPEFPPFAIGMPRGRGRMLETSNYENARPLPSLARGQRLLGAMPPAPPPSQLKHVGVGRGRPPGTMAAMPVEKTVHLVPKGRGRGRPSFLGPE